MKIFHYTYDEGIFYAVGIADESPLEPGVFHIPAHATDIKPPSFEEGEMAVFADGEWRIEVQPLPTAELGIAQKFAASGLTLADLEELLDL
jgi:hypothetical protein